MDYSTLGLSLEGDDEGFVVSLNSLYARWCGLTDARKAKGKRYPLALVLVAMVVAKLAGADKPQAIADWVAERAALFVESFERKLPTMPSHHTYRRVMRQVIVVSELAQTAQAFLAELPQTGVPVQICLDGKTLRGNIPGGDSRGLQLLAAYWPGTGLVLCQVAVDPSTNEIGAAPQVLKALDLKGKTPAPPSGACRHRGCAVCPARTVAADRAGGGRLRMHRQRQSAAPAGGYRAAV